MCAYVYNVYVLYTYIFIYCYYTYIKTTSINKTILNFVMTRNVHAL